MKPISAITANDRNHHRNAVINNHRRTTPFRGWFAVLR